MRASLLDGLLHAMATAGDLLKAHDNLYGLLLWYLSATTNYGVEGLVSFDSVCRSLYIPSCWARLRTELRSTEHKGLCSGRCSEANGSCLPGGIEDTPLLCFQRNNQCQRPEARPDETTEHISLTYAVLRSCQSPQGQGIPSITSYSTVYTCMSTDSHRRETMNGL